MNDYEDVVLPCGICGEKIDRPFRRLPDASRKLPDYLFNYCEAFVHQDCLARWQHRLIFSNVHFEDEKDRWISHIFRGHILAQSDLWVLTVGERGPHITADMKRDMADVTLQLAGLQEDTINPLYACVTLKEWPFPLYTVWNKWDGYISGGYKHSFIDEINDALEIIAEEVRRIAPTTDALNKLLDQQN